MTDGVDLLAAVGGQAVQDDGVGAGGVHGGLGERVGHERGRPVAALGLLAHGHPGVGGEHVGAVERGRAGPATTRHRPAGGGGAAPGVLDHVGARQVPLRPGQPHVHARGRPGQGVGVGHVVRRVAEVGEREPGQPARALAHGLQVGEQLAGVEVVGEGVDHGDGADRGHPLDPLVGAGAPDDGGDLPVEHAGGVLDRLAPPELRPGGVDDQRVAAEVGDADRERDPGPGAGLVEERRPRPAGPRGDARRTGRP